MPISPKNEDALQRKSQEVNERRCWHQILILEQVDIGGKHGNQQGDDSPRRQMRTFWNQQQDTQQNLTNAADQHQFSMKRKIWRHDLEEEFGVHEVHRARHDHEDRQQAFRDRLMRVM